MSRRTDLAAFLSLTAMSACSPQPRSASYFEAHPQEAAVVVKACLAGNARGDECDTAEAGQARAAANARMAIYRKSTR